MLEGDFAPKKYDLPTHYSFLSNTNLKWQSQKQL